MNAYATTVCVGKLWAGSCLKLLFLNLVLFVLFGLQIAAEEGGAVQAYQRKTLLVLSCKGGGGHTSALHTLKKLFENEYDIHVIYPIDQLHIWGISSGEQLYNSMLQSGWTRSMNFIVRHIAPPIFKNREQKLEMIIDESIGVCAPDLIISLIPFVNYPASEAARKRVIPFLLVTTDNDLRHWVLGLEKLTHPDFKVTIGSDLTTSRELLLKKNIPASSIETIGLPLRPEFIAKKDEKKIREEFAIDERKPVILIMMGGAGGNKASQYAKKIGQMDLSAHIIVVMGSHVKMKKELEKIPIHPSNTMTFLGFTDRVADLMAISHVIVTKPGPGTISEAIAMKLPILIDNTDKLLFWERINVDLVLGYGIGQRITHPREIEDLVGTYLQDPELQEQLEISFASVPPNHFHLRIRSIVGDMVALHQQRLALKPLLIEENISLTNVMLQKEF
jgi:UDP-N-acetylglucosamine:LPS N-acetylglucosamine transferase